MMILAGGFEIGVQSLSPILKSTGGDMLRGDMRGLDVSDGLEGLWA